MPFEKNEYTSFGQMLVAAGILNIVVRIYNPIDLAVTFLLLARGASVLKNRKWSCDRWWNFFLAFTGILWPAVKLFAVYFFVAPEMASASQGELTVSGIMTTSSVFLLPASALSLKALLTLRSINTETKEVK